MFQCEFNLSKTTLQNTEHKPKRRFGDLTEDELIDKLKAGDDQAWKILYDGFYAYVFQLYS